ncbi:conjugative transfer signal peptidase TraF [Roseibium sediminicola]|uniref:Conjugative transfer signal peptidase TraF n=1 Tax=Roseibium sediminicola TaxID=2933272 RepID=A0ABT0H233_9HYPH|nr:conjugative transfer signal peptidase TraF [Roseibium sp. CAU 1639]MCK7615736.1 conjugative transfer signal peptidase TraF [Roseibium sp. CAU 1639]
MVIGGIAAAGALGGYRINTTPSFPLGLWRIDALSREVRVGDTLFICPPADAPAIKLARERLYLPAGFCEGGIAPLIKTVVALPGQTIAMEGDQVAIDGERLVHSSVQARDGLGRALPTYAGGVVPAGALFVHSNYVASFDSRYFGPIPASGILGLAREVFTFQP